LCIVLHEANLQQTKKASVARPLASFFMSLRAGSGGCPVMSGSTWAWELSNSAGIPLSLRDPPTNPKIRYVTVSVAGTGSTTGSHFRYVTRPGGTLGFSFHGFWAGRESLIFGVWAAPAAPKTIPKGGGLRPPPSGMVLGAAGAAQTPKIDDIRPAQTPCIQNLSVSLGLSPLDSGRGASQQGHPRLFADLPNPASLAD
jgi:hypothetical protein